MKNRRWHLLLRMSLIVQICIVVFSLTGCNVKVYAPVEYSNGEEYESVTRQEKGISFSFEYPATYRISPQDLEFTVSNTLGTATLLVGPDSENGVPTPVLVITYPVNKDFTNIDKAVRERISKAKEMVEEISFYSDLKFLEERTVMVGSIKGKELLYSYKTKPYTIYGGEAIINSTTLFDRFVFLSYDNLIFEIHMEYDEILANQATKDYEHILKTFKILK